MSMNHLGYLGSALLREGEYTLYGWLSFTGGKFVAVLKENYAAEWWKDQGTCATSRESIC